MAENVTFEITIEIFVFVAIINHSKYIILLYHTQLDKTLTFHDGYSYTRIVQIKY